VWVAPLVLLGSSAFAAGAARYRAPFDPLLVALGALSITVLLRRFGLVASRPVPLTRSGEARKERS
jgi:hypothetical protein